jgi:hypothetical protein
MRLAQLAEALAHVDHTAERYYEANVYRLKGQLLLHASSVCSCSRAVPRWATVSMQVWGG